MDRAWVRDVWVDRLAPKDILHLYFTFVKYYLIYLSLDKSAYSCILDL